jgi:hypothetical protein
LVAGRVDWVGRMNRALAGNDRSSRTPVAGRRADPGYARAMTRRAVTRDGAIPTPEVVR